MSYQIFTDATADHNSLMFSDGLPIEIIPMRVEIGGREFIYGPQGNISVEEFYDLQKQGNYAITSQINPMEYIQAFELYLEQGKDILYLCFSSGLSGTYQTACFCAKELDKKYPKQKIICIDTLCASVGQGFLIKEALQKQKEGLSINELATWVMEHRLEICHWFTVDKFDYLRHGGRVSATAAAVGTKLQIKPLLHVDNEGRLVVAQKPHGRKQAMKALISHMKDGWNPEISKNVVIGHGSCLDRAKQLQEEVLFNFPDAKIDIADIGPIIGAHTGPGMLALIYWGNNR